MMQRFTGLNEEEVWLDPAMVTAMVHYSTASPPYTLLYINFHGGRDPLTFNVRELPEVIAKPPE